MSRQSTIGKQSWQRRAPLYAAELQADIEQQAAARFAHRLADVERLLA
jgi:hypothetical protein